MEIEKIIIGLEVHVELKTASKMFCSCSADHFGKIPNTQTCPVCLGLPGALPVPNKKAVEWTILLGAALGGEIQKYSCFERKNYFYPDLPKGYQISQYRHPFILGGAIVLNSGKKIRIKRIHLEEDTGKLLHETVEQEKVSLIDFNRSGVPLVEIVSEPDINSSEEAKEYLEKIQKVVRYLDISSGDMEKGSMRCEPNVNLAISDSGRIFYTPIVELKNINSFRFVKKAIDFEVNRLFEEFQKNRIEKAKGNKQTRGWDDTRQITFPQREKEEENDYRYFPDPDIPPIEWTDEEISNFKKQASIFELPWDKKARFQSQYLLSASQAEILTEEKTLADFFEQCSKLGKEKKISPVEIANIIINKRSPAGLSPAQLIDWISHQKNSPSISEAQIDQLIIKYLSEHKEAVAGYKAGKVQALGVIVGLIKKETGIVVPIEKIAKFVDKI